MDSNEKAAQTIDFNKAKVTSTYKNISRQILDTNDTTTRVMRRLQTTLSISGLIDIFTQELAQLMKPGQVRYEAPNADTFSFGDEPGAHSCQFNLAIESYRLGKLTMTRRKRFSNEEISIVEFLASTLVFPLKNALMYEEALSKALTDELTGMGNKRALQSCLHRETERSIRRKQPLSTLIIDIDHFKKVNDTHGHRAGDAVLKQFGSLIQKNLRKTDLSFRYGGEEFVLILEETDKEHALQAAERIRQAVQESNFAFEDLTIPVSASFGCATYKLGETMDSFIERADQALYLAKNSGRNTVRHLDANDVTINHQGDMELTSSCR